MRVLIAGESWTVHSIHQKGFDSFTTTDYAEGVAWLRDALVKNDHTVTFQPSHIASREFPSTVEELQAYDCIVLSDIGANTLLLHPETFTRSRIIPNRLDALKSYVLNGGGLVMIGGYMTFQGIDGKARYQGSPVEDVLPVRMMTDDDRVEAPQGLTPEVNLPKHEIMNGIHGTWPRLLGLNSVLPGAQSETVVSAGDHPLLLCGQCGKGRSVLSRQTVRRTGHRLSLSNGSTMLDSGTRSSPGRADQNERKQALWARTSRTGGSFARPRSLRGC